MRSPLDLVRDSLFYLETSFVPYRSLWWRFWTPTIGREDRYQDGFFEGYGDDDDLARDGPLFDIRRNGVLRQIYKALPYVDVVPVQRNWLSFSDDQRRDREMFVIESTKNAYDQGKALYTRDMIRSIEDQLDAYDGRADRNKAGLPWYRRRKRHAGRSRPVGWLLSRCEAPQTSFVHYVDYDDVRQHQVTWITGAAMSSNRRLDVYGRSQIEFRTIQELLQPDPDNTREVFVPDQWEPSVAYNTLSVRSRKAKQSMDVIHNSPTMTINDQLTSAELNERLAAARDRLMDDPEWQAIEVAVSADPALLQVDKIVFFYAWGFSDNCDLCKRAIFLLAVATRLRDTLLRLRGGADQSHVIESPCAGVVVEATPPPERTRGESRKRRMKAKVKVKAAAPATRNAAATSAVSNDPIPIFVPAFDLTRIWNEAEMEMLTGAGATPVDSNGELFLKIDERTAVISYRSWNPVKQVVADIARPAVMICKPVRKNTDDFRFSLETRDGKAVQIPCIRNREVDGSNGDSIRLRDPDSPRTRAMLKNYAELPLPKLPGDTVAKEHMSFYTRKPDTPVKANYWR